VIASPCIERLRDFVIAFSNLVETNSGESGILREGSRLLRELVGDDRPSTSIHVYGANIGAVQRSMYQPDGTGKTFISGYSNTELPNLWDRSKDKSGN